MSTEDREYSAADTWDTYSSHSPIEDKEFSAGRPPLGHDDPVEPNPHRDDPDVDPEIDPKVGDAMSTEEPEAPEVDEPDEDTEEETTDE